MMKFSSNAVEKLFEKGGDLIISKFIEENYLNDKMSGKYILIILDLMRNNYGNYVVQKALKLSSVSNKQKIISLILKNIDKIGDLKLILKWRLIVQDYITPDDKNFQIQINQYESNENQKFINKFVYK